MLTKEQKEALQLLIRLYADEVAQASVGEVANPAEQAEAINAFLDELTAPEGWQMVPVEPTREMLEAAEEAYVCGYTGTATAHPASVYAKMLAAAPKPGDSNE